MSKLRALPSPEMNALSSLPIRLAPGADLRLALEREAAANFAGGAFVVAGIGSLASANIRFAAAQKETRIDGPLEVLTLSGTLSANGAHLHISVATSAGRTWGGHLCYGSTVRTTAEVLLVAVDGWRLTRKLDADTGYLELWVQKLEPGETAA